MRPFFWILVSILLLPTLSYAVLVDRIVAVVDREAITWSELYKRMEFELSDMLQGLNPPERRQFIEKRQKEYLEKVIDTFVLLKEAEKENISVTEREIREALEQIRNKYNLTPEGFKEAVQRQGLTFDEYRRLLAEQIIINKLISYKISSNIVISEEEVAGFMKDNPDKSERSFLLREILIKKGKEDKLEKVLEGLKEGIPFDILAKRFSDSPTARDGGRMGLFKESEMAVPIREALKGKGEGEYTDPIYTDKGIHILFVERILQPGMLTREKVVKELREKKFNEMYTRWLQEVRKKHFIEIKL